MVVFRRVQDKDEVYVECIKLNVLRHRRRELLDFVLVLERESLWFFFAFQSSSKTNRNLLNERVNHRFESYVHRLTQEVANYFVCRHRRESFSV